MSDVNNVTLIGRLTRDADLKYTANGKTVAKFSLAVNEKRKAGDQWKDEAGFFEIVLWGQAAESLQQYLAKGKQVAVVGRLTQERWEQDGQNRSKVTVTAATVQLLGSPAGSKGGSYGQNRNTATPPVPDANAAPAAGDDFVNDIPESPPPKPSGKKAQQSLTGGFDSYIANRAANQSGTAGADQDLPIYERQQIQLKLPQIRGTIF
jgi:single-strand DNA-binding protein